MTTFRYVGEPYDRAADSGYYGNPGMPGESGQQADTTNIFGNEYCLRAPTDGSAGGVGGTGSNGAPGIKGRPAPSGNPDLGIVRGTITIEVGGGRGQDGGRGGDGGEGGIGGYAGGNPWISRNGGPFQCPCPNAKEGPQGVGGKGGNGGNSGDGGDGSTIVAYYDSIIEGEIISITVDGDPGMPGDGGQGGKSSSSNYGPGAKGLPGRPGSASKVIVRQR
ncbi:hypothetical protein ACE38W_14025 [Chitinophaga sp. Hz27]|uniref:hypothetical protein n=1 Tax=Chitinophaga sp. Hz27 TaxID=3347169 RepID=UPI0035DF3527